MISGMIKTDCISISRRTKSSAGSAPASSAEIEEGSPDSTTAALVSESEQLLGFLPATAGRDPEARRQHAHERVDVRLDRIDDPGHDLARVGLAGVAEQQCELVAAHAERVILGPHELFEQ